MARALAAAWRDVPHLRDETPAETAYMRHRRAQRPDAANATRPTERASRVDLDTMPVCLVGAVIGAEDPWYFSHRGIAWRAHGRVALDALVRRQPVRGVSTITQQLARNLYLRPHRSLVRKLHEAVLARRLESVLTKRRILELYLGAVELGEGVWGVEAGARAWFGVPAAALDPFQCVVLASLLPAPRVALTGANLRRATSSQYRLLAFLYGSGLIDLDEEREAAMRIMTFAQDVAAGADAPTQLRMLASRPWVPQRAARPSMAELLAGECGLALRISYTALLRGELPRDRWAHRRPRWWTGTLLPE